MTKSAFWLSVRFTCVLPWILLFTYFYPRPYIFCVFVAYWSWNYAVLSYISGSRCCKMSIRSALSSHACFCQPFFVIISSYFLVRLLQEVISFGLSMPYMYMSAFLFFFWFLWLAHIFWISFQWWYDNISSFLGHYLKFISLGSIQKKVDTSYWKVSVGISFCFGSLFLTISGSTRHSLRSLLINSVYWKQL